MQEDSVMTLDERQAVFVAAFELGQAYRCRLDLEQAEHDAAHAAAKPIIDAMVSDMNRRGAGDHAKIQQRIHDRQVAAAAQNRASAIPWPPEAGEPEW